ncbi:MAG: hypothetical protein ACM3WV_04015 [Bacillota bacterium]
MLPVDDKPKFFWWGFVMGMCANLFLLSCLIYYFVYVTGISLTVEEKEIALKVKQQVTSAAENKLPVLLDTIKKDVKSGLENNINGLGQGKLYLADMEIGFSDQMMDQIRKCMYLQTVNNLDDNLFDQERYKPLIQELADEVYGSVQRNLSGEATARKVIWQPARGIKIPVTVTTRP